MLLTSAPTYTAVPRAYVLPSTLRQLPAAVRAELNTRQCWIPLQRDMPKSPKTPVIYRGAFYRAGEANDWAVLCSRVGTAATRITTLLLFRGTQHWRAEAVGKDDDTGLYAYPATQFNPRGEPLVDRLVQFAKAGEVENGIQQCGEGPDCMTPRERALARHDGLVIGYHSDGRTNYLYWSGWRWLELPGAD